jgi:acyl carrier protein
MLRRRGTIEERVKPQSDEEFVAAVTPSLPEAQKALLLPLRRMIAAFGNIEIDLVRSDVTFDDLDIGPADSIDELDLILRLEAVLGFELTNSEKAQIPSPDYTRKLLVGRFIRAVCAVAAARAAG